MNSSAQNLLHDTLKARRRQKRVKEGRSDGKAQTAVPRAEASAPCTCPPGSAPLLGIEGGGEWKCLEGFS